MPPQLGIKPRRTIRAVLHENEENRLRGSKVYGEEAAAAEKHIFAIETIAGALRRSGSVSPETP